MKFKQILLLTLIVDVYIFLLVGVIKLLTPDKPKPITNDELRYLSDTCPTCISLLQETGTIEPIK